MVRRIVLACTTSTSTNSMCSPRKGHVQVAAASSKCFPRLA